LKQAPATKAAPNVKESQAVLAGVPEAAPSAEQRAPLRRREWHGHARSV